MPTEKAITARCLSKHFRVHRQVIVAVDRVSLEVERGETFGLIGPDGAGKSTLTRLILGLLNRTAGESSVLGLDSIHGRYAIRERTGYLAQQFALPADLTVMENMQFFADMYGLTPAQKRERLPRLLNFAGLTDFTGRAAGKLSGGMKKKLALACCLLHQPPVVLLDEPTLGVDPVSRREFWNLLGNLRAEHGLTIFVCTPYMDEAERCNRVGLIYRGRLIANDTPAALKRLVGGQVLEFTPGQFNHARRLVSSLEGVQEVQTYGMMLHVFVDQAERRRPQIEAALTANGLSWSGMRLVEPRLEEAFISLIKRAEAAAPPSAYD